MNYLQLYNAIQDYSENTEQLFVANIPTFIGEAEKRIYNSVQLPSLRKNVVGTATTNNKYISLPDDWLSTYSLAVIDANGRYEYLLNKDVNYIRQAYPTPNATGLPKYYAVFGPNSGNLNELSLIVGPTPDANYSVELHYFYYPVSIVQGVIRTMGNVSSGTGYNNGLYSDIPLTGGTGVNAIATILVVNGGVASVTITDGGSLYSVGDVLTANAANIGGSGSGFSIPVVTVANAGGTSWLGDNYDPVLFYGAMREAMLFMKSEADLVGYYEQKYQEALSQLNRLGTGLERGDSYRDGQAKIKVNP
jgi:hypothetical protein